MPRAPPRGDPAPDEHTSLATQQVSFPLKETAMGIDEIVKEMNTIVADRPEETQIEVVRIL